MKIGIAINIDVTKIDKTRLHKGEKGLYLDLTTFIDTENQSQYGSNGFITQSPTEEERKNKDTMPILGNCKVFFKKDSEPNKEPEHPATEQQQAPEPPNSDEFIDEIPF